MQQTVFTGNVAWKVKKIRSTLYTELSSEKFYLFFFTSYILGWVISHFFQNFKNGVLNFYAYGSKNPCDIIFFENIDVYLAGNEIL